MRERSVFAAAGPYWAMHYYERQGFHLGGPYWVHRYYERGGWNYVADVSTHWTLTGARLKARRLNRREARRFRDA